MYLTDIDKDLANVILLNQANADAFTKRTINENVAFMRNVIERIEKLYPDIATNKYAGWVGISPERHEEFICSRYSRFKTGLLASSNERKNAVAGCGWHHAHGAVYQKFYQSNNKIFCSYFSEAHPKKEFKHEWNLFSEDAAEYFSKLVKLHCNPVMISSAYDHFSGANRAPEPNSPEEHQFNIL